MIEELRSIIGSRISISEEEYEMFARYHAMLLEWNKKLDLTNISEKDIASLHYADSILPLENLSLFSDVKTLVDVGTGAGFPGLMIAIMRQDIRIVLLDSLCKRCEFLDAVKNSLNLNNVHIVHARAEEVARTEWREGFDLAVARALAPLNVLVEYLLPFVKPGGRALCWKGPKLVDEIAAAQKAVAVLGGQIEKEVQVSFDNRMHFVLPILKISSTDQKYPRKSGIPTKRPL